MINRRDFLKSSLAVVSLGVGVPSVFSKAVLAAAAERSGASLSGKTLIIVQIETRRGLDNVEEIADMDGVDVLWIGQTDLTCSLGIPGQFDHPDFEAAIDRVLSACRNAGKVAGFMPLSLEEARRFRDRGFRMLAYSGDLWIYQQALRTALEALQQPE